MTLPFPPSGPRTPATFFPQDYDPTAGAALEMMRAGGRPLPGVPRQPVSAPVTRQGGATAPAWFNTLFESAKRFGGTFTDPKQALQELLASSPIPKGANPLDPKTMLGFAGSVASGAPEAVGPGVSSVTRPILSDIENAAAGAESVKMPQAAIVSASLGDLSAAKNAARHKSMLADLKASGVPHVEVSGRWLNPESGKWETEKSVLIPGMERAQAVHYGDRWGQHSVLTIGGDEPGMHNVATGETTPFAGVHQAGRREAHTVLPSGKKISFDFEGAPQQTGTPAPQPMPRGAPGLQGVAEDYRQKAGLTEPRMPRVTAVDPEVGKMQAQTYANLKSDPSDPNVQAAYKAFTDETHAQAEHLKENGITPQYVDKDPYTSSKAMLKDLRENKSIRVLKTQADQAHPLMTPAQNDEFRFVHDVMGHGVEGNSFNAAGEENAARAHAPMYSPLARSAMLTETRGQNSWFNFGPHADLPANARPFAEQKAALWPITDEPRLPSGAPDVLGASDPKLGYQSAGIRSAKGMTIPQSDVPGLAMGVAHLGAGAKTPQAFAEAVSREHPQLGAQMKASPWLASKMYATAKKYRDMIEKMPTPEQAIATARSPEGQGIQKWYNGLDGVLREAGLSDRERDVFHRIGAISSMQKSPKDELARALDAFATWKRAGPNADFSKMRNYTPAQRKMLSGIAADAPWTKVTQGPKVSGYVLARQNQPEGVALDRHINEYYTGKQRLNDTERQIVEGRLRSDATKAGMSAREFQAALWGGKTKYAPGFGEAGATLEDWLRFHLSSGKYEDLLEQVPGFQTLAEEGAHMSEHLPPSRPGGRGNLPF